MADHKKKSKKAGIDKSLSDLKVVHVACSPAPDAEDRLRKLVTLMIKFASDPSLGTEKET